jgi:SET domain-containing protein
VRWLRGVSAGDTQDFIVSRCFMVSPRTKSLHVVRSSLIHGKGVFAKELIRKGTRIIEYRGLRSTIDVELKKPVNDPLNPHHTFLFELSDGSAIEAGVRGNAARWINHSCHPNCEAIEDDGRVFIHAKRTIRQGEELTYDYCLTVPGRVTKREHQAYACYCGAKTCRGSMLMVPEPPTRKKVQRAM